jgi:AAHS family 4-hydroxybenzoate transporter-like MFS transporter
MANSHSVTQLGVLRMLAGVGIGGALPNVSALVAELSPTRNRAAVVTLTIVCVPLGGMIGGLVASAILPWLGWRALFTLGGVAPLIMAVIFWRLMPESPQFLLRCPRRAGELQRLLSQLQCEIPANATFGTKANGAVASESRLASILRPPYRFDTWALWGAFGCCLFAVYSVFSWAPTLLTESRFTLAEASRAVGVYNFGGVLGALICASAVGRFGSRRLLISLASLAVTSAVGLWLVAASAAVNHGVLVALLGFHGFCVNGVQTSLYGLAACAYPVHFRSTGVGAASSVGRIGAIVSSFSGAALLGPHSGNFYLLLALSMAGNAVCLILLRAHIPRFGASEPPQMRSECLTATHPTKVV